MADVHDGAVESGGDHREREQAQRQVDVEDPAPGEVVDEEPAEERPDHGRDAEDGAEETLVFAPLAWRHDVPDHGHRRHDQAAAADPLEGAERDQLAHVLREPAKSTSRRGRSRSPSGARSYGRRGRRASRTAARPPSRRAGRRSRPRRGARSRRGRRRSSAAPSTRSSGRATPAAARASAPRRSGGRAVPARCDR